LQLVVFNRFGVVQAFVSLTKNTWLLVVFNRFGVVQAFVSLTKNTWLPEQFNHCGVASRIALRTMLQLVVFKRFGVEPTFG
jgi:hypothetical protein